MDYIRLLNETGRMVIGEFVEIEGELMDIFIKSPDQFKMGQTLYCIYKDVKFKSCVLKIYGNHLFLYVPLFQEKFADNRRKIPRLKIETPAHINDFLSEKIYHIPPEKKVNLLDFNVKGFGFLSKDPLNIESQYFLSFHMDDKPLKTKVILRNEAKLDNGYRYGSEISAITKEDFQRLRSFVLLTQLKNNVSSLV